MAEAEKLAHYESDVIIKNCEPLFKCLFPQFKNIRCNNCFTLLKTTKESCDTCDVVNYCTVPCKMKDWDKGHMVECLMWQSQDLRKYCFEGDFCEHKLLLLRIYAKLRLNRRLSEKIFMHYDGTNRCLKDLKAFQAGTEFDEKRRESCRELVKLIKAASAKETVCNIEGDDLLPYSVLMTFGIKNETYTVPIGLGIYPETCFIEHSCRPTAQHVTKGIKIDIRIIEPIKLGDKPSICYIMNDCNKEIRQGILKENYNFDCTCTKCTTNFDANINYDNLNTLLSRMNQYRRKRKENPDWDDVYITHENILKNYRKMYNEYDSRITSQFKTAYDVAKLMCVPPPIMKRMRNNARIHALVTYGVDHYIYKMLK